MESITNEGFDISEYISVYVKQLSLFNNENYDILSIFQAAVAINNNCVIYRDLPLKIINEFENNIDWESEVDDEEPEFSNPWITHLNPQTKTFITSIMDNESSKIHDASDGILIMNDIAERYGYTYKIVMNKEIPKIITKCRRLHINPENIVIINEELIKQMVQINKTYLSSGLLSIKSDVSPCNDNSKLIKLRDYQLEYIDYMNNHNRGIFKLPCGMGKSYIMIYHMLTSNQHATAILVPNIALVDQFKTNVEQLAKQLNVQIEIHRLSTKNKEYIIEHQNYQQIIISVYNSFVSLFVLTAFNNKTSADANSIFSINKFDTIYIDEAHHIILPSNKKQKENMNILLEQYNKTVSTSNKEDDMESIEFVDLLHNSVKLNKAFSNLIYAYVNLFSVSSYLFSATITPANFSKFNMFSAIEAGYLCRLNIDFIIDENYSRAETNLQEKVENLVAYIDKSSYKSIIIYTSRVLTAREIKSKLKQSAEVITCSMSPDVRQKHFENFKNHNLRILLTVNCISEGVDLPNADTAIFFDDKKSIINIIQCVGRVMRTYPDKLSSTLVIPAYNDDDLKNLYVNILSVINGELGYGTTDLRRIVSIKFNCINRQLTQTIKEHVKRKICEYDKEYFEKISVHNKINMCKYFWNQSHMIPTIELNDFKGFYTVDGYYMDVWQFVKDNLYQNNYAGRELRKLYKLNEDNTLLKVNN